MIKVVLFIFLVIPLVFFSVLLLVLFFSHSTLCTPSETSSRANTPSIDFPQPILNRFELDRIVRQVRRSEQKRSHYHPSRQVYYFL